MPDTFALKVFTFEGLQLRTVEEDGEIWFVAKDIAQALEYSYWRPTLWLMCRKSGRVLNGLIPLAENRKCCA